MAGIYIHVPFCAKKCAYCDFFSVANNANQSRFVDAVVKEIELRKNFFQGETIQTIYFGGGTPSLLSIKEIDKILNTVHKNFPVELTNEITLEANPDNLKIQFLKDLRKVQVNRLSIGIQSFRNEDLKLMRRTHTAEEAIQSVKNAKENDFNNISIDLIYGLPNLSINDWEENIRKALDLKIQHISAYHLTIEKDTLFNKYFRSGKIHLPSEKQSLDQFKLLKELTSENGLVHYEISNFALDGFLSLHNTNYWMDVKYLGLGPSAHSYNLTSREWNISNLPGYLDVIFQGKLANETEILNKTEKFNEYLITSLRTMWGISTEIIKNKFGLEYLNFLNKKSNKFIDEGLLEHTEQFLKLSEKGIFISDHILQNLMYD